MTLKAQCPHCGQVFTFDTENERVVFEGLGSGTRTSPPPLQIHYLPTCPGCRKVMKVPSPRKP